MNASLPASALALQSLPIRRIAPSPSNPRKRFDAAYLDELATSIGELGMIQPITVRPLPLDRLFDFNRKHPDADPEHTPQYEIVVGECRWRAATLAGLAEVQAFIRDLDDKQVLEIQVVENLQRRDVHPLEEADGYQKLIHWHGYRADDLALKIGKSLSYVFARLKLCALGDAGREMFYAGGIEAPVKAPSKAKVIVEKPERTPAEVRNALADLFERRGLGLPADEDDATSSEAQAAPADAVGSAAQGYEVIELETGPDPDPAAVVEAPPITADKSTVQQVARDRHFGGCSYEASLLRRLLARIHRDDGKYLAEHGLDKAQDEAEKKIVQLFPLSEPTATSVAPPIDEVRFLFGCDGRLQVLLGDQRIICTREETAAVGRMMSALEPVWNV